MNNLKVLQNAIIKRGSRALLVSKKYSPEILMTLGVIGVVTSTVLACRATLRVEEVLETAQDRLNQIHDGIDNHSDKYTKQDAQKDLAIAYTKTAWDFAKLYGPSITLGAASIGMILGSHNIMKQRNVALLATYKALETSFNEYRQRVSDEFGPEKELRVKHGTKQSTVEVTDEKGKKSKKKVDYMEPKEVSIYAKYFDKNNKHWDVNPEYNRVFLTVQQNYANDMLRSRGHVFLNEVYDMLGIKRTEAGALVGWVEGQGDDYIDFGIMDVNVVEYRDTHAGDTVGEERIDFINGHRDAVLLDFNVSGMIYNMI